MASGIPESGHGVIVRSIGTVVLLAVLLAGLLQPAGAQEDRIQVVATNSITGDLVSNVAGDLADVVVLVGANGDSHTFEPTPADADVLATADIVFENGLGLEVWLDDVYEASGSGAQRVVVTDAITPLPAGEEPGHEEGEEHAVEAGATPGEHAEEGEEHAEEGEFDPHVWFDVANVKLMVAAIEAALVAADETNAADYTAQAVAYQAQLDELDAFIVAQVEALPVENRGLVTSHDTFAYFAARYGFEIIGTALPSITTESGDPSASEIAALVDEIVASGVPAIFPENVSNADLLEQIASESGVTVAPPLYTDALGEPGGEAGTYIDLMTYDVTAIVTALQG